jgi:hypothetical protein
VAVELSSVVEVSSDTQAHERYTIDGEAYERSASVPETHLRAKPTGMSRVYAVATGSLRVVVRAFYLFPVLVVAKIVLFAMHARVGDYITVAFVVLVVTLFGLLAVVMLLVAITGSRSQRPGGTLVFHAPSKSDAQRMVKGRSVAVRVMGRVDAGLEPGATVLEEQWGENGGKLVRFFEGRSFVVVPDEGAPVVVDLDACPLVLARYDRTTTALAVPGIGSVKPLARWLLRQGERVEIIAPQARPGTHALLQSEAAPYRDAGGTMVATGTPASPLIVRAIELS